MNQDLWDQLATTEVPPVPADFNHDVHQRLNYALLLAHVAELAMRVAPYAIVHMAKALFGWTALTLSGRYPTDSSTQDR